MNALSCVDIGAHYRQKLELPWLLSSWYEGTLWGIDSSVQCSRSSCQKYWFCFKKIKQSEQIWKHSEIGVELTQPLVSSDVALRPWELFPSSSKFLKANQRQPLRLCKHLLPWGRLNATFDDVSYWQVATQGFQNLGGSHQRWEVGASHILLFSTNWKSSSLLQNLPFWEKEQFMLRNKNQIKSAIQFLKSECITWYPITFTYFLLF